MVYKNKSKCSGNRKSILHLFYLLFVQRFKSWWSRWYYCKQIVYFHLVKILQKKEIDVCIWINTLKRYQKLIHTFSWWLTWISEYSRYICLVFNVLDYFKRCNLLHNYFELKGKIQKLNNKFEITHWKYDLHYVLQNYDL